MCRNIRRVMIIGGWERGCFLDTRCAVYMRERPSLNQHCAAMMFSHSDYSAGKTKGMMDCQIALAG